MKFVLRKRDDRKRAIKEKAQEIIYARYPQWKQANLLASGDTSSIEEAWTWINAVRVHSDELEAQVDMGAEISLESGWPG